VTSAVTATTHAQLRTPREHVVAFRRRHIVYSRRCYVTADPIRSNPIYLARRALATTSYPFSLRRPRCEPAERKRQQQDERVAWADVTTVRARRRRRAGGRVHGPCVPERRTWAHTCCRS